ncbi:MAG: hypothetical protein ACYCTV_10745 [Leptospirales bacterium]
MKPANPGISSVLSGRLKLAEEAEDPSCPMFQRCLNPDSSEETGQILKNEAIGKMSEKVSKISCLSVWRHT